MTQTQFLTEFRSLPSEAQTQVIELVEFLQRKHRTQPPKDRATEGSLETEPFVGMWRDREEQTESSSWVRQTRQGEWGEP